MKIIILLLMLCMSLPSFALPKGACNGAEIRIINNANTAIIFDSVIPDKGILNIATGKLLPGQSVNGKITETKAGTARGYLVFKVKDQLLYYIKYDYHAQKSWPLNCIKEIAPTATGSGSSLYQHAIQGEERKGNERTIYIFEKSAG